ncbi:NAD(P)-dependent oxidoreductase [Magnetospirillum sp. 64-120]|uniref:NAD-dependent epimerase/dehydratase family protein n=1 Tax=Magnetospirillum sp. 64-120 TaxID=1895778 RepID=UPI00092B788E|nr:NAD(P)-dependent oxidoreductase [Magnetospirillum sp. 64-120]OJX68163.1 MAG: hypothetical protein BGO92_05785 [Magnetospirillum sp. 64-120]
MNLKTVVIGASGFLGSAISAALGQAGHTVVPVGRGDPLPAGCFDVVVDCAGDARRFYCNSHPRHAFDANVVPVLDRLLGIDAGLYVFASTVDVYGAGKADPATSDEESPIRASELDGYSFSKFLAEQLVARHARRALILRLGTLIGPNLRKNPVFDALNGHPLRIGETTALSLVDTRFVAQTLLTLLEAGIDGTINVTGRGQVRTGDIVALVQSLFPGLGIAFHSEREDFHYDVAVHRLAGHLPVPSSVAMLERFMAEQAGKVA